MNKEANKFIVISHTHWDREWYSSFYVFRLRLVDLIDRLFEIIEKDNNYIFHLDAQTVILEDYLEIKPENEEKLKKYIKSGNICVGPWYLQNDFFLTSGESTIRNLQIGRKIAKKFGKCGNVGYAPDQFGNVSQMPQILNGFDIDTFIFGRGLREYKKTENGLEKIKKNDEFVWEGADNSRCTSIFMDCWYNNAQRIPNDVEKAKLLLDINKNYFNEYNETPYVLLMNGVDHLEAQDDLLEIIDKLNKEGYDVEQTSLDDYVELVKKELVKKDYPVYKGAMDKGHDYEMLRGCWSSRIYLKRENVKLEDTLINKLEPLYSYLEGNGLDKTYPLGQLNYAWKELIKNHPHDSICGCSVDSVHAHMEDNFIRLNETCDDLILRGMKQLCYHSNSSFVENCGYLVAVFNPTEISYSGLVETKLEILKKDNIDDFKIIDMEGNEVEYQIVSKKDGVINCTSPLNLPGIFDVTKVVVRFYAKDVKPFSSYVYALQKGTPKLVSNTTKLTSISNDYYEISFNNKLVIKNKVNGKEYVNPIIVEDGSDKGDAYVYRIPKSKELLINPTLKEIVNDGLKKIMKLSYQYDMADHYDFENDCYSKETVKQQIDLTLTLDEYCSNIKVDYNIINKANDHRIRLLFDFGIGDLYTDTCFDCTKVENYDIFVATDAPTNFAHSFAYCKDQEYAIYNQGQFEVQKMENGLAFTILRSTGFINRDAFSFSTTPDTCWEVPGNQNIKEVYGKFAIELDQKFKISEIYAKAKQFRSGVLVLGHSFDDKKFQGGRFAVQDTKLEQLYYIKDKHEGFVLNNENTIFTISNDDISFAAYKVDENGKIVIRLVNLNNFDVKTNINCIRAFEEINLAEEKIIASYKDGDAIVFKPKQIKTFRF